MSIRGLLRRHARVVARGRALRGARGVVLVGGTAIAVALFLERAGLVGALPPLPGVPGPDGRADRVWWFLAVSFRGLVQGAALLAFLFAAAALVRWVGPVLFETSDARTAALLDRAAGSDRFTAALEARGPLAPLVERRAVARPPPDRTLRARPPRLAEKWLRRFVVALVLVVALAPGTAPGAEGDAPVAGEPAGGTTPDAPRLRLLGEKERVRAGEPVPVQVIAEAPSAPADDLVLPVRLRIDDRPERALDHTLFLAAGAPGQDALGFDLRPFLEGLEPGEHVAVARAGPLTSNEYRFRLEGTAPGGGGAAPPPPEPEAEPPAGGPPPEGGDERTRPRFVEPLVRGDDRVRKRAKVPIETRGGGAPSEVPLEEAWPELERRKEAELARPGLSPGARKLVKEYFDRLRPAER